MRAQARAVGTEEPVDKATAGFLAAAGGGGHAEPDRGAADGWAAMPWAADDLESERSPTVPDPRHHRAVRGGFCATATFDYGNDTEAAAYDCLGWRQTAGCDPAGGREPLSDQPCNQTVRSGWSGAGPHNMDYPPTRWP